MCISISMDWILGTLIFYYCICLLFILHFHKVPSTKYVAHTAHSTHTEKKTNQPNYKKRVNSTNFIQSKCSSRRSFTARCFFFLSNNVNIHFFSHSSFIASASYRLNIIHKRQTSREKNTRAFKPHLLESITQ